jgi:hypothetical protein
MPISRKIWGWFVYCLGLLWIFGGIAGVLQGHWQPWLFVVLGIGLLRLGYNLKSPGRVE